MEPAEAPQLAAALVQQQHHQDQQTAPSEAGAMSVAESLTAPNSDPGVDAGNDAPPNPRKRKKASRACDFCHVNHQPCDNGKPECSVCKKHNKPCLYLRPTKRRGPQKGYRTALNTYKESAAAWGAVLGAIPGLDALIEGHLRGSTGRFITGSIKDSAQQDALIAKWQESSVFRAFFGHNNGPGDVTTTAPAPAEDTDDAYPPGPPSDAAAPLKRLLIQSPTAPTHHHHHRRSPSSSTTTSRPDNNNPLPKPPPHHPHHLHLQLTHQEAALRRQRDAAAALSDLVAKDAAASSSRGAASQTLASLGFAPNETIADFYSMGSNPEPLMPVQFSGGGRDEHGGGGGGGTGGGGGGAGGGVGGSSSFFDPDLGSESDQRAYYELLMGRSFPG
ncbi:quinic acid utilization activator [Podospora conica]|nr:quinic acid utilization activator [Schizothecium conicum]